MMNDMMQGYWWMWFGPVFVLSFFILVIIGIAALIKWISGQTSPFTSKTEESALEILKKRYAKGEINKEEFEEKKKDIV